MFVLVSKSTQLDPSTLATLAAPLCAYACEVAEALGIAGDVTVRADDGTTKDGERTILCVDDDARAPGAAGYHAPGGAIVIEVGAILAAGGDLKDSPLSVSSVIAHEIAEELGDVACNLFALDGAGLLHAYELCDATEADTYKDGGVTLSNYLLPSYFDPAGVAPFDRMGVVAAPFSTRPGGYQLVMDAGQPTEVYGAAEVRHGAARLVAWRHDRRQRGKSRRAEVRGFHIYAGVL